MKNHELIYARFKASVKFSDESMEESQDEPGFDDGEKLRDFGVITAFVFRCKKTDA